MPKVSVLVCMRTGHGGALLKSMDKESIMERIVHQKKKIQGFLHVFTLEKFQNSLSEI
jgi:hypothetical protein